MKYSVHVRPPTEVIRQFVAIRLNIDEYITRIPASPLHCTVMCTRFREEDESALVKELDGIEVAPFELTFTGYDIFDENALVARFSSEQIQAFHEGVCERLRRYIAWDEVVKPEGLSATREQAFHAYGSPYYGEHYNPHITICQVQPDMPLGQLEELENPLHVTEFCLSKKRYCWEMVQRFAVQ